MGISVQCATSGFATFAGELSELWDHRSQDLQDDRCGDVGIDTHRGDAELAQRATAEEV